MIAIMRHSFWRTDIAIDLGTAVTRVALGEYAPLVRPSMADGLQALRSGVVADHDATVAVLRPFIRASTKFGIIRPKALVCVPTDVNEQEREAVVDCLIRAGASTTVVVPEPLAAAIGSGVDMLSPYAHMILDIGEGVTDCAIIKEGAIIASRAVRVGCCELREAVKKGVMEKWGISVSQDVAEYGMRNFNISYPYRDKEYEQDNPITKWLPATQLYYSIEPVIKTMLSGVTTLLREIRNELYCDIIDSGIIISGGGALLPGMRERVSAETGLKVCLAPDPLNAVVIGARSILPFASMLDF